MPPHLREPLRVWLANWFGSKLNIATEERMLAIAAAARIPVAQRFDADAARLEHRRQKWRAELMESILDACEHDEEAFLDAVDAALHVRSPTDDTVDLPEAVDLAYLAGKRPARSRLATQRTDATGVPRPVDDLRRMLTLGGSAWTVAPDGGSLQRRVDPTAQEAFRSAVAPRDVASEELRQAWALAYGRDPHPSGAWTHGIKAVEAALIPVVCPDQNNPTLGHVLGELRNQGARWWLRLPGANDKHDVEPLVRMLDLLWPNPDRHGSPDHRRPPTAAEAEDAVQLAVMIVQWSRDGGVRQR